MSGAYECIINGVDLQPSAEWDATWEERVDGIGNASVTIQDRDSSLDFDFIGVDRNTILMKVNGTSVYHGEVINGNVDLPSGFPFRKWALRCSDYNTIFDLRLVGAADGLTWETIDGGRTYRAIDPDAHGDLYDDTTVQALFARYMALPDADGGGTFDTSTFVFRYMPSSVIYDAVSGKSRLDWTNTTMRAALDELRGMAGFPLFYWIDPDDKMHWIAFPDPILGGPDRGSLIWPSQTPHQFDAPAVITDVHADIDGTTIIGGRNLQVSFDATYMPQRAYVVGVTDFIHGVPLIDNNQGTGWRDRHIVGPTHRQILVDAQSVTTPQRQAIATRYQHIGQRARIRGSVTVGKPDEAVDGWRCGQMLQVFDARLPDEVNGLRWPIQRVSGSLKAGNDFRVYTLEFGDAPIGRFSEKYRENPIRLPTKRLPANNHIIDMPATMRPSSDYTLTSHMVDHSGKPLRQSGVPVNWSLVIRDASGATVGGGSITPITETTDRHGSTAATLSTGSATGLHYHVLARTVQQS